MPGFDKTGPLGKGTRTGRGFGKCNPAQGENPDENSEPLFGRGMGRGRGGRGRGLGRGMGRGRGRI
jgi:hypothetical protein